MTAAAIHDQAVALCEEVREMDNARGACVSRWRCKVCQKTTDYKSNTLRHIRVAHTQTTYRCVCGVEFKWSDSLKKHRRKCGMHQQFSATQDTQHVLEQQKQQEFIAAITALHHQ